MPSELHKENLNPARPHGHAGRPGDEKTNDPRHATLLPGKKLLAFRGAYGYFGACVLAIGILASPSVSHAGILSSFWKFLGMESREVEDHFPSLVLESRATAIEPALAAGALSREPSSGESQDSFNVIQESALLAPSNPLGTAASDEVHSGQIFLYTVRAGDTMLAIAKSFDVSVNTILWANGIANARSVKPGQSLLILPVTGIRHEVKRGDTLSGVAKKYHASVEDIIEFNGLALDEDLKTGTTVIVPNGELADAAPLTVRPRTTAFSTLPSFEGYYMRPIVGGRRSRGIHGFNGVDLASSCGLSVIAAQDGSVLIARTGGWNGGYGNYVVITHPNGTQTLYSHLKELRVVQGEKVAQGREIGLIGSSGNSTGCHVHFEVRGARNPF